VKINKIHVDIYRNGYVSHSCKGIEPPKRIRVLSGVHASDKVSSAFNCALHVLVCGFHILIRLYQYVAIASSPDGEYRTQSADPSPVIEFPCASQVFVFHSFVILSEPVASTVPSGEKSSE
jgi:hypothetical protein